ncbi:PilW family protein [Pelomonas aquatica]|jgi:prepilin-type N-terminal cleavage/methylation domain-containing protein|nr:prepilin-type N-terminal cleavage/methylation domain-containing protein [Pelomonas aquatica]MCY4754689.1 prepilin-type N-terminal cleavage/methylation domain-containing protein [Pelomonas aquatica]
MLTFHSSRRRCQDGLSLIELMVGMAIGAFIIVGVMYLFTADIQGNRKLIATTRVEQDLRNITDLITRDVRRAGYWGNSVLGTVAIGATAATTSNPYLISNVPQPRPESR